MQGLSLHYQHKVVSSLPQVKSHQYNAISLFSWMFLTSNGQYSQTQFLTGLLFPSLIRVCLESICFMGLFSQFYVGVSHMAMITLPFGICSLISALLSLAHTSMHEASTVLHDVRAKYMLSHRNHWDYQRNVGTNKNNLSKQLKFGAWLVEHRLWGWTPYHSEPKKNLEKKKQHSVWKTAEHYKLAKFILCPLTFMWHSATLFTKLHPNCRENWSANPVGTSY